MKSILKSDLSNIEVSDSETSEDETSSFEQNSDNETSRKDREIELQVAAFKKIYPILWLVQDQCLQSDFLKDKKDRSYEELYEEILRQCQQSKNENSRCVVAWKLARIHFLDFSNCNKDLIEAMTNYICQIKSGFLAAVTLSRPNKQKIYQRIEKELARGLTLEVDEKNHETKRLHN